MIYPFAGSYPVTQTFGDNPADYRKFGLSGHNGIDFALPTGTQVLAALDGKVIMTGSDKDGYGNYVKIEHSNGLTTLYAHLTTWTPGMTIGMTIPKGRTIGLSGNTGNSTGPHLHFEVRDASCSGNGYGGAVDPMQYLVQPEPETTDTLSGWEVVNDVRLRNAASLEADIICMMKAGTKLKGADIPIIEFDGIEWIPIIAWVGHAQMGIELVKKL